MIETIITIGVILFDQLTKLWAKTSLIKKSIEVIPGIIEFVYTENTGMAFGMLGNATVLLAIFSVIMSAVIIFMIWKYKKTSGKLFSLSLSMILGGAIGNAIDRIFIGYVTDFINPIFIDFAIFNVADSFICVGTALFAIYILFFEEKHKKEAENADNGNG